MPSSSLAAYLAKNYLTASNPSSRSGEPPKKKRKKSKHDTSTNSGLMIADDDEDLTLANARTGAHEDEDGDTPMIFEGRVRGNEFRRAKKNAWQALAETENAAPATTTNDDDDDNDADELLRGAQSDEARRLAEQEAENAPTVVELPSSNNNNSTHTESGPRAGLQTAADTARLVAEEEAREEAERKTQRKSKKKKARFGDDMTTGAAKEEEEEETIYRDATGRRIDVSLRRAEARREEAERARAAQQEKLDAMGEVQRQERESRRKELDEAKFLTLGRSVEDDEYNDRLKDQVRWDDPMAAYMAEKRAEEEDQQQVAVGGKGKVGSGGKGGAETVKKRREYQGPAPPNRYGIKPGWRWDGVDRGNGFEKEWFQARSRRSRNEQLSYEWQMDE